METRYNMKSPAVKRLMKEAQELHEATEDFYAQPLEDNLFEWHFTVRGASESEFDNGLYHGRIILPPEYPMKPPSIILLTPNGRFEINKKICLSISGYHPESWQPSWSIRTALVAIIGFMPTPGNGAIGSLDYTADERKLLAKKSREWKCKECGSLKDILPNPPTDNTNRSTNDESVQLAAQINFKGEGEQSPAENGSSNRVAAAATPLPSPGMTGMPFSQLLSNPVSISLPSGGSSASAALPHIPMRVGLEADKEQQKPSTSASHTSSADVQVAAARSTTSASSDKKMDPVRRRLNTTMVASSVVGGEHVAQNAPTTRPCSSRASLVFIFVLGLAIFGLLCRRLFML